MKTMVFAAPAGVALAAMIVSILTGCAAPPPTPALVNGKLIVDHNIMVPDGGILLGNGPKTRGVQ